MAKDIIQIDSIVTIYDCDLEENEVYKIVSTKKDNNDKNALSFDTPLAKALMGHSTGDIIHVPVEEEYMVKVLNVDNSQVTRPIPPQKTNGKGLTRNLYKGLGTRAYDIYLEYCKKFGWKTSLCGHFAPQKSLYGPKATLEGYSVIFLAHNTWMKSKTPNRLNVIMEDRIEERWEVLDNPDFFSDVYTRVVFAKNQKCENNYVFLGVYAYKGESEVTLKNGLKQYIKNYERIYDTYGDEYL